MLDGAHKLPADLLHLRIAIAERTDCLSHLCNVDRLRVRRLDGDAAPKIDPEIEPRIGEYRDESAEEDGERQGQRRPAILHERDGRVVRDELQELHGGET